MSEDVLIQLLQDINRENVRFGTVEVGGGQFPGRDRDVVFVLKRT